MQQEKEKQVSYQKGKEECLGLDEATIALKFHKLNELLIAEKIMHNMVRKYCPPFDSYKEMSLNSSFDIFKMVGVERAAAVERAPPTLDD
ncbi:unnamed protein product [Arabis nemorensis]|uniref:Uncharacterized protein n=1 Tax=Arabis nemorensis TaxID=586526 RepID=A0A565C583_9BRAS|nr:unnamed protein product [Arabis nemorensis]